MADMKYRRLPLPSHEPANHSSQTAEFRRANFSEGSMLPSYVVSVLVSYHESQYKGEISFILRRLTGNQFSHVSEKQKQQGKKKPKLR